LLLQAEVGLLTLTGPGGIGKTRLALQVAAHLLDHFVDGVYFVALASVREPDLVVAAIAQTLGVHEVAERRLQESLQAYLGDKQLLLILDNFEQVVVAAPIVGDLLAACHRLKTLVTSRVTLHLYCEQEFPVPLLALPDLKHMTTVETDLVASLMHYAAIELFIQRARATKPDFTLTTSNAAAVASICNSLDGLPLAIELAAARIKVFAPSALLARLQARLTLLTGGPHDLPARQRTLRDAIAWSYDLLAPGEQRLFQRLAVFVGGLTLEAAQAVGIPSTSAGQALDIDVLDGITTLLDQNLVKRLEQSDREPRFGMFETIREYGLERLEASGEAEAIRGLHTTFYLALAEAVGPSLFGAEQGLGLARLTLEYANLRAALAWSQQKVAETETALRLAIALQGFWLITGLWSEGRRWLEDSLARMAVKRTMMRAHALVGAGELATIQGDYSAAHAQLAEGMAIAREQGAPMLVAMALMNLGLVAYAQHDHALTTTRLEEALAIAREVDDKTMIAPTLVFLGNVARDQQNYAHAQSLYEEALVLFQTVGSTWNYADTLVYLGQLAQQQGELARAWALFQESLARWQALGTLQWKGIAECLEGLANICASWRQFVAAARLFGVVEAMRESLGISRSTMAHPSAEKKLADLHVQRDEAVFVAAWVEGRTLSPAQAVEFALALPNLSTATPLAMLSPSPTYPADLTAREVEVLRLLAQGLTYAQIAANLIITRRTVNGHVTSIYSKLGVNGRAAATRFAMEHQLV
jgi:predicted ATPase/DNA-binding CsgD family transcriptional regulator